MRTESDMIYIVVVILGICLLLLSLVTRADYDRLQVAQESMEQRIYELERALKDRT